jgi:DNA-binding transcriptional MerR regulator
LRGPEDETPCHGALHAGDVGEIVGVSGTTIGQWARHGYIRPSRSAELPHVYAVEDVGEASIVAALRARGVRHADIRAAIHRLAGLGPWPLSEARLSVTAGARLLLHDDGVAHALTRRGWQVVALPDDSEEVRLRLRPAARG